MSPFLSQWPDIHLSPSLQSSFWCKRQRKLEAGARNAPENCETARMPDLTYTQAHVHRGLSECTSQSNNLTSSGDPDCE
jgi:hypothetical protein